MIPRFFYTKKHIEISQHAMDRVRRRFPNLIPYKNPTRRQLKKILRSLYKRDGKLSEKKDAVLKTIHLSHQKKLVMVLKRTDMKDNWQMISVIDPAEKK